jgi:hypothetical protein
MGIDKIRKRKKKTKKYKKRIPFWAGGESYGGDPSAGADDGGPGSGPSGPDGPSNGSDNSEPGISPAPTPTPTTNFSDNSEPGVSPTPTVNFSDTNEPGVSPVATTSLLYDGPTYDEEVGINTPPTTPVNFSDTNEPGINPGLYNPPAYTDGPTYDEAGIFNTPTFKGPNYDDDQKALSYIPQPIKDPKGGFLGGLKSVAKFLAMSLIPGLLPAQLAKAYQTYKTGKGIYNAAKYVGDKFDKTKGITKTFDDKVKSAFKPGPGGTKPPTGFNGSDNNEGNALVTNNVIAKSVQEYSPEEIKNVQNYVDRLNSYAEKGTLNKIGQQTLTQMNQVLKQYQV